MAGKNDCGMAGKVGGKWEEGNGWRETGGGKLVGGKWVAGNGWREKRSLEMSITFKTNVHHNGKRFPPFKKCMQFFWKI